MHFVRFFKTRGILIIAFSILLDSPSGPNEDLLGNLSTSLYNSVSVTSFVVISSRASQPWELNL